MGQLHETMLRESADLLEDSRNHPFLLQTADGTIPDASFLRWLEQDYLWVLEFERFLSVLAGRAPKQFRRRLAEAVVDFHSEVALFEELAAETGANLFDAPMTFSCHAYRCFLQAAAHVYPFEEAMALCYASEYAYMDAWTQVKLAQKGPGRWQAFIDRWSDPAYREWVAYIASVLDALGAGAAAATQSRMIETFQTGLFYEIRFWDMAFQGPIGYVKSPEASQGQLPPPDGRNQR